MILISKNKKDLAWAEAKKRCRLNQAEIQMAKELGMTPKSLLKNIPSPSQQWKSPVKVWVRQLHEEKFGISETAKTHKKNVQNLDQGSKSNKVNTVDVSDEDLTF